NSPTSQRNLVNKKDVLAYFFVAGTGALVQLLTSSLAQDWFGLTFNQSINVAYPVSLVVGFILTKLFAFNVRNTNQTRREMVKFVMVARSEEHTSELQSRENLVCRLLLE